VRRKRLYEGVWAAQEGLVYEWDAAVHLVDRFEIPKAWRRIRVIDFGFTNPFVCQWWAIDGDGRMYRYREIYRTGRLVEDHVKDILEHSAGEAFEATIADHDAEDRATAERHGLRTIAAHKALTPGIQAVQARMARAGDGKPRLFLLRDSLVERDETLSEAKKPASTEEEFDSYHWPKGQGGKELKEAPVKIDDHGCDAARYGVAYVDKLGGPGAAKSTNIPNLWQRPR
jgi:phage terminase large subunit